MAENNNIAYVRLDTIVKDGDYFTEDHVSHIDNGIEAAIAGVNNLANSTDKRFDGVESQITEAIDKIQTITEEDLVELGIIEKTQEPDEVLEV
jgi:hypothetical protein